MVKIAKNKKTGKLYRILREDIINATNDKEDELMVLYMPIDLLNISDDDRPEFVREKKEFYQKFDLMI